MNIDRNTLLDKTLALLEYPAIMEKVAGYAHSEEAAEILKNSKPVFDTLIVCIKEKVKAIFDLKKTNAEEPKEWLPRVGFLIPKLKVEGTVLELDEAHAIGLFIERGLELLKWIDKKNLTQSAQSNAEFFIINLPIPLRDSVSSAVKIIFEIIDKDGNLRDLPVIREIKKRIENLEKDLKTAVSRYCSDDEYKRMLQSAVPSQRDGRAVIAVKSNYRGRIKGIVREASSSGQTVYIEPADVVEKNNDLLIERRNLDMEIQKLLRELTVKISVHADDIKAFHAAIIELECFRAKASYSIAIKGYFPRSITVNYNDTLHLNQARHPLLKKPVPINIKMNENIRTLIITGPNTGGKTVALKTLGLLAMMNQSALALPLEEPSNLPIFDGIYADIGDEQSIDQSLSTFSAHITNISAIAKHAGKNSLVLLDELGSGTDPEEGGAIAMAVLDFLIEKNARMIVTTHHGILKHYGYTTAGVENASVEFDPHTLSPTYKIINGMPGESRAIDIAQGNGLDMEIVEKARRYIDEEKSDISEMIKGLELKQRELSEIEKISAAEKDKLKEERRRSDLKDLQLRQKEAELKREYIGRLSNLLSESRKTLENLVREIKEGELTREKTIKVKDFLNEFADIVDSENAALDNEENAINKELEKLEGNRNDEEILFTEGMEVIVKLSGQSKQRGAILRKDKKIKDGHSWIVKVGALKISIAEKDLSPVSEKEEKAQSKGRAKKSVLWSAELNTSQDAVYELMVRKMKLEEALEAVKRQIDAAVLSGLKTFAIIHGKGYGILRTGIHDYLRNNRFVKEFHFSRPELGGFGRTEVVLH